MVQPLLAHAIDDIDTQGGCTMADLEGLLRSYDQREFAKGMELLRALPVDEAISVLERLAVEPAAEHRCGALEGMAEISPERAEGLAIRLLHDAHKSVRWFACDTLGKLEHQRSIPLFVQLLATDPNALVRHLAAFWLGELGDESALPALMTAAERDTGTDHEGITMRETATKAIRKIRARLAGRTWVQRPG
jgi:HEAT repeat protein